MASSPPTHPSFLPTPPTSPARWPVATSRPTPCRPPSPTSRPVPPPPRSACNSTTRWPRSASRSPASPASCGKAYVRVASPLRGPCAQWRTHGITEVRRPLTRSAEGRWVSNEAFLFPTTGTQTNFTIAYEDDAEGAICASHLPSPPCVPASPTNSTEPSLAAPSKSRVASRPPNGAPRDALFHLLPRCPDRYWRHKLWRHSL